MDRETLRAKAEWYLLFSRAFLPPMTAEAREAFAADLPRELAEASADAGHALAGPLEAFAAAVSRVDPEPELLQAYAALFLVPPVRAHLHAAVYLDGAVLGGSVDRLLECHARFGVARADGFRDLPDHLASILEFVSLLMSRGAEAEAPERDTHCDAAVDIVRRFLLPWMPALRRRIGAACAGDETASPNGGAACARDEAAPSAPKGVEAYAALAALLHAGLSADAGVDRRAPTPKPFTGSASDVPTDPARAAACVRCGTPFAAAARVRRVERVLRQRGIDTDHLAYCPRCRGAALAPPSLERAL